MRRSSLALRLVLAAAVWTTAALGMAGLLLQQLFLDYLRRNFDSSVTEQLSELAGSATIGPDGEFALARLPILPAFQRPGSGSYWQVITPDEGVIRSPSLGPASLSIPPPAEGTMIVDRIGPEGEPLRMALRRVPVEGLPQPATVAVAFDSGELTRSVQRFGWLLAISLLTLGAGLLVAIFVQVWFGLAPLHRLRSALAEIRSGRRQRL